LQVEISPKALSLVFPLTRIYGKNRASTPVTSSMDESVLTAGGPIESPNVLEPRRNLISIGGHLQRQDFRASCLDDRALSRVGVQKHEAIEFQSKLVCEAG